MFSSMKNYVFLFFGLGSVIGFGFVWVFVPETKGVPMEKMYVTVTFLCFHAL
jgi:hypothetical protein